MKDRVFVLLYLSTLVLFTSVHDLRWMMGGTAVCLGLAGRDAPRLLRRALLAVLIFNLTVSMGVVVAGLLKEGVDGAWLVRANLRVLLLTTSTLLLSARVDPSRALSIWPSLVVVVQLVRAQVRGMQRTVEDFQMGLRSRSLHRPGPGVLARHGAATGSYFLGKALHDAEEISFALRARGGWSNAGDR